MKFKEKTTYSNCSGNSLSEIKYLFSKSYIFMLYVLLL